jgi:hypothetical protein
MSEKSPFNERRRVSSSWALAMTTRSEDSMGK